MIVDESGLETIVAHYKRVAPLLAASLPGVPLVSTSYPDGFERAPHWHASVDEPLPPSIPSIDVDGPHGMHTYVALAENSLLWLVHRKDVEFFSWAPRQEDATACAFARILLLPLGRATAPMVSSACFALHDVLRERGFGAVLLVDGFGGAALWIPLADGPAYPVVRAWLTEIVTEAVRQHPTLVTNLPRAEAGDRVHLSVQTNAAGRFSWLPYSVRAVDPPTVVTPVSWHEARSHGLFEWTLEDFERRLAVHGDVFARETASIGRQMLTNVHAGRTTIAVELPLHPRGRVISAAVALLADGKPRSAQELLDLAIAQRILPKSTTVKYVYSALIEYIARSKGHDRKPLIVQNPDRRFRINHPADDWPAPRRMPPPRTARPHAAALVAKLRSTGHGDDPAAFEQAVCEAFTGIGFSTVHIGGSAAPDGYADAPLGALGYRVMLECKTARKIVTQPDALEAAKYREPYHAAFAALVGPAFGDDIHLATELKTHGVSAWTIDDLAACLEHALDPYELRAAFAPGFAADAISELLWSRAHGPAKRVALVCESILDTGWEAQVEVRDDPASAPRLTDDAAMMLVDQRLAAAGAMQPCTRDDVRAAFDYLTNPLVAHAVWTGGGRDAIVITGR